MTFTLAWQSKHHRTLFFLHPAQRGGYNQSTTRQKPCEILNDREAPRLSVIDSTQVRRNVNPDKPGVITAGVKPGTELKPEHTAKG